MFSHLAVLSVKLQSIMWQDGWFEDISFGVSFIFIYYFMMALVSFILKLQTATLNRDLIQVL
jgi:hypothetical protein